MKSKWTDSPPNMNNAAMPHQEMGVPDRLSLQDVIVRHRPRTIIEILPAGKQSVLCFRNGSEEVFLALDYHPQKTVEENLISIANMLVGCECCANGGRRSALCRREFRLVSRRLQVFLGAAGYQDFLSHSCGGPKPVCSVGFSSARPALDS
jgi:hypothetical protein